MARTIAEIQQEIYTSISADSKLSALTSVSKTAVYRLLVYVFAYASWLQEKLYDRKEAEINTLIAEQKRYKGTWYKGMALNFQYGFDLVTDMDYYDNTEYDEDTIEASKIIKYCSVKRGAETSTLIVKVASEEGDILAPLDDLQKESFVQYMEEIKCEGEKIRVINNPADKLLLTMAVYRDVLVLDDQGNSKLNGGKPVEDTISAYMKALPFDGELVLNDLIEKLRAVDGVENVNIVNALSSSFNTVTNDYDDYLQITVKTIPAAGYFEIVNFDSVTYVV